MATNSSVAITAGSGTAIDAVLLTGGDLVQSVSERSASASTTTAWTVSTTAAVVITASPNNVAIALYNTSGSDVYVGFGATTVTASVYALQLPPQTYYEVPVTLTFVAVSLLGKVASGTVLYTVGTEV